MIPRLKASLGWLEIKAVFSRSGGSDVNGFERSFAQLAKQKHAIAFPYGRTALVAIIRALDLNGAEIICPSYTCVVVPHAIVTSGNIPVFIDSDPDDFNMDLELVDKAVTSGTRVIICTSIFGHPVNLDHLDVMRNRYPEIIVIQDCAHSFFCEWEGRPLNKEGICAFYGFNISKIMTSIFGGMVTTDDDVFADKLRQVRDKLLHLAGPIKSFRRLLYLLAVYPAFSGPMYGLVNRLERSGLLNRFVRYYDPGLIDMPQDYLDQMTEVEARVGTVQCQKYHAIVTHRRNIAKIYLAGLSALKDIKMPSLKAGATYSHFVLRSNFAQRLKNHFLANGIQLGGLIDYYIPDLDCYRDCKVHSNGNGRRWPAEVVNLPVHTGCSEQDALRIVKLFRDYILSE